MGSTKTRPPDKPLLLLMDGHAMVYRAWHAIQQPMTVTKTREEVQGVYGFLNTFLRTLTDLHPTHCAITFDLPGPTFRHQKYTEYKAQRPKAPPELRAQFPHVRKLIDVFKIPVYEHQGYEGDDILGTLCRQAENQGIDVVILTGDTDEFQLVSPTVKVLLTYSVQKRTIYDVSAVKERYDGLGPEAIPDIKALQGDPSDNIPGVPGIGKKIAIRLLKEFGSLEGIFENLDQIVPPRIQESLSANQDNALRGKFLTTIVRDVPVKLDLEATLFWRYDRNKIIQALMDLEFVSIVDRIPSLEPDKTATSQLPLLTESNSQDPSYEIVNTETALVSMVKELSNSRKFALEVEITTPNAMSANLVGIALSNTPDQGWYVPVGHSNGNQLPLDQILSKLRPILEKKSIPKIAHDANSSVTSLLKHGIEVNPLEFDTMLAAHVSGKTTTTLKALALEYLKVEVQPLSNLIGSGRGQTTIEQTVIDQAASYFTTNTRLTYQIHSILDNELNKNGIIKDLKTVEIPVLPVLARMQANGISLDIGLLETMSLELAEQVSDIETNMYKLIGHEFKINSSQQLGDVLFKELGLPATKRTQKGHSTDAASLEWLRGVINQGTVETVDPRAITILSEVVKYRQLTKIKSTYVDSLPSLMDPHTGRVHTIYNQTGSTTGRVSSNDPNVQNIPIRTALGRRVRRAFIPRNATNWMLLAADYSQIELRVLAHLSQDIGLVEAFHNHQDIHDATAASVYSVPLHQVTPVMRRIAKIMNFGVIYGLSPFGISQQTGLSTEEGKLFTENYFGKYPGIRDYINLVKAQVRNLGYVETLNGRRRHIPEINSNNFHVRSSGERMAVNMPIQGTAADILKIAMSRIQKILDDLKMKTMMIIQVHDELVFEAPRNELEDIKAILLEIMPSAMNLAVPLDIEIKTGHNWGDME